MVTIYVIKDSYAEDLRNNEDLESFRDLVEDGIMWQSHTYPNTGDADIFCAGLCNGHIDERAPLGFLILRDDIEEDIPFIETLMEI